MKKYIIVFLIGIPYLLFSQIVARVENFQITSEQLHRKIQELDKNYTYLKAKEIALQELINERALLVYAAQNDIYVTEQEIEQFFIAQFGGHPSLQTEGFFDYEKFLTLKNSERGQQIWEELKQDLLLDKIKTMVRSSLDIGDDKLLEKFVLDNVRIDINYALMELESLGIDTDFTPEKAFTYFAENKHDLATASSVQFSLHVLLKETFRDAALSYVELKKTSAPDSILTDYEKRVQLHTVMDSLWQQQAAIHKENWQKGMIDFPIFETAITTDVDVLSPALSAKSFLQAALASPENEVGIYQDETAIILYKTGGGSNLPITDLENNPRRIWSAYMEHAQQSMSADFKRKYFKQHFEDFIVPAAIVTKIPLPVRVSPTKKEEILAELSEHLFDDEILESLLKKYRLNKMNEIVYLEKYENSRLNQKISEIIKSGSNWGIIEDEQQSLLFRYSTLFPEYIPPFSQIEDQIIAPIFGPEQDTTGFFAYYQEHPSHFFSADSLQLGGVFVPVKADTVLIPQSDLEEYYEANKNFFVRDKAVQFDYLFLHNEALIKDIYLQLNQQNFAHFKYLFHQPLAYPTHELIEYNSLPEPLRSALLNCFNNRIVSPIRYGDGWLILWKQREHQSGLVPFAKVEASIRQKLQFDIANRDAFQFARTVFESTRYFSHSYQYAPSDLIFKTSFRNIDDTFEYLGRLQHKDEFLRLWNNEKYSSILEFENGYAVVFLLRKKTAQKMEYEDSIEKIAEIFYENMRFTRAMTYANFLRTELQKGAAPDSLFFFFGGWKEASNLSLRSSIPGIRYSDLILNNIIQHDKGYLSPVLNISEEQLFLYKIAEIRRVPRQHFYDNKANYKNQIMQERYDDWLQKFKSTISITVY